VETACNDPTLDKVTSALEELINRPGARDKAQEKTLEAVSYLAQPRLLADLLRSLRADPRTAATCVASVLRAPVGFRSPRRRR
jgi:hypothetical protein